MEIKLPEVIVYPHEKGYKVKVQNLGGGWTVYDRVFTNIRKAEYLANDARWRIKAAADSALDSLSDFDETSYTEEKDDEGST